MGIGRTCNATLKENIMRRFTRRDFLNLSGGGALAATAGVFSGTLMIGHGPVHAQTKKAQKAMTMEEWMDQWLLVPKAPGGALHISRFKDPIYFLTKPIGWKPNPDQAARYQAVDVPTGFVTDFASIPRVFWSLLRPDGEYTYPAIVHDFLYWTQERPRDVADEIFRFGMQDFEIDRVTIATIHKAVRVGGNSAWQSNAKLKAQGEKRILKEFPEDPRTLWRDWKKRGQVFAT